MALYGTHRSVYFLVWKLCLLPVPPAVGKQERSAASSMQRGFSSTTEAEMRCWRQGSPPPTPLFCLLSNIDTMLMLHSTFPFGDDDDGLQYGCGAL